jgi:hypothetical protein
LSNEPRLSFSESNHPDLGWGYEVYNDKMQNICSLRRVRTGQWMHWSIVVEPYHLDGGYITISPGCQDELRAQCKRLGGKK